MKHLDFQDYTTTYEDADGDEHETTVSAAKITEDLVYIKDADGNNKRREVMTPTGARVVSEGDVFMKTERDGVYDYISASGWAATGYDTSDETPSEATSGDATPRRTRRGATSGDDS